MEPPRIQRQEAEDGIQTCQEESPANTSKIAAQGRGSWQRPPEFWERLSKIPLARKSLKEFDRRVGRRRPFPSPSQNGPHYWRVPPTSREVRRFGSHGGPDLSGLRGFPHPTWIMRAHEPARRSAAASIDASSATSTSATSETKDRKLQTAYDSGFSEHLTDYKIHPAAGPMLPALDEARAALAVPRPSLTSLRACNDAFSQLQILNAAATDEADVTHDVIPIITGPRQANQPMARNTLFGGLRPLTDGTISAAKPDLYYGAHPQQVDRSIRDEIKGHIIPSVTDKKPIVPNFFVEVNGPDGSSEVAKRQARYHGAIGSRAMHALQNYGGGEPSYDGKPYTFTSTYHGGLGVLQINAHHVTAPAVAGGRPEYHTSRMGSWLMDSDLDSFRGGVTAFRNARDLAKEYRDAFIQAANSRLADKDTARDEKWPH